MTSFSYDELKKAIDAIGSLGEISYPLKLYESVHAVETDKEEPTRRVEVKRSWKERLFTWPWRPWVVSKTITVPNYKPAIYMVNNMLVYHPALRDRLFGTISRNESE